jgi:ABC-type glycerol-3-phosphate transport system substrate-binding protein
MRQNVMCLAILLALAGCQGDAPAPAAAEPIAAPEPPFNPLQAQMDALQKAKGLEEQMNNDVKRRQEEVDAMTGQ